MIKKPLAADFGSHNLFLQNWSGVSCWNTVFNNLFKEYQNSCFCDRFENSVLQKFVVEFSIFLFANGPAEQLAYNLIRWATFRLQKVNQRRERWTIKARKGKDEKEDRTLKREKPPHQVWGFFWVIFNIELEENWNFDLFLAHWLRLWPTIYPKSNVKCLNFQKSEALLQNCLKQCLK